MPSWPSRKPSGHFAKQASASELLAGRLAANSLGGRPALGRKPPAGAASRAFQADPDKFGEPDASKDAVYSLNFDCSAKDFFRAPIFQALNTEATKARHGKHLFLSLSKGSVATST